MLDLLRHTNKRYTFKTIQRKDYCMPLLKLLGTKLHLSDASDPNHGFPIFECFNHLETAW